MRFVCLALLLVALVFLSDADAWRRRRWRRILRRAVKSWAIKQGAAALFGRDVRDVDVNNDGMVDQSEAEKLTNEEREARELLSMLDENEDSIVSLDEFERGVREINQFDNDELMDLSQENTV